MSKRLLFSMCIMATVLYFIIQPLFCMNSALLDRAKQYEKNIEKYCLTDEEFVIYSDTMEQMKEPEGVSDALHDFTYYERKGTLKQIYRNSNYVCIITWTEGQEIPDILRYVRK